MKTGIAVALAWPETYCKQAGGWYDDLLTSLGFNRGHYYRAGHAALVLIRKFDSEIHYFDFGRYHAPKGHGRVRSATTDPELALSVQASWSASGKILNLDEIMAALNANPAYHGDGILYASTTAIDFNRAFVKAQEIQNQSPIVYGPFTYGGSNCSRFVNTVLLHSRPGVFQWLRLYFPWTFTPTPMSNVRALGKIFKNGRPNEKEIPTCLHPEFTLPEPRLPETLPHHAQWLSGEGAGSWFTVDEFFGEFLIHRFSPSGQPEFGGVYEFVNPAEELDLYEPFEVVHLSHFQQIRIHQNGKLIRLQLKAVRDLSAMSKLETLPKSRFKKITLST